MKKFYTECPDLTDEILEQISNQTELNSLTVKHWYDRQYHREQVIEVSDEKKAVLQQYFEKFHQWSAELRAQISEETKLPLFSIKQWYSARHKIDKKIKAEIQKLNSESRKITPETNEFQLDQQESKLENSNIKPERKKMKSQKKETEPERQESEPESSNIKPKRKKMKSQKKETQPERQESKPESSHIKPEMKKTK